VVKNYFWNGPERHERLFPPTCNLWAILRKSPEREELESFSHRLSCVAAFLAGNGMG